MRRNGILAESLFVDNVQIERYQQTTPLSLNHRPRRPPTSLITATNGQHQQRRKAVRHRPQHAPTHQQRRSNATSPPAARKRAPGAHNAAMSLPATWQTTNDDISRHSSSLSQVSTHHPSPFHTLTSTRCHVAPVSDVATKW